MNIIDKLEEKSLREIPPFKSGDTVAVSYKIKEGEKERIQIFEGIVISRSGASIRETFTVRKSLTVLALKEYSQFIQNKLIKLMLRKKVKSGELNFIILEDFPRKHQGLKRVQNNSILVLEATFE